MDFRSGRSRKLLIQLLASAVAIGWPGSAATAQGVRYTLLPSASYVRWDTDLDLERALMFGGRVLADFGPLVGLEAHYLVGGGIVARFSESALRDSLGAPLENSTLDVTDYGIGVRVNIGSAGLDPFLRAGGSVLRFDEGARSGPRQIALSYGGGIRINASPRLRAELFVDETRFRLDRSSLASAARPGTDPQRDALRRNLTLGAGLGFVIGGGPAEQGPRERWSVASVPLEAFGGRIDFDDPALGSHSLVGVRAGVDAGNYVGLRAYYLRGVSDGFRSLEALRSIGGEARFNLNAAPRLAPYLVIGGGTVGFASDFRDADGDAPPQRTTLILGGGIGFRLTDKFRLDLAVRDFIHGRDAEFGDVSAASELQHNPLYSAGVSVSIGRSRKGIALVAQDADPAQADSVRVAAPATIVTDTIARVDSAARAEQRLLPDSMSRRDSAGAVEVRGAPGYHSATSVVLPVPTEGELYVRYGPPVVRDTLGLRAVGPTGARTPADSIAQPVTPPVGARPPGEAAAPPPSARVGAPDTAFIGSAIRRMFDERRRIDSVLIRDLVSLEVNRWRADAERTGLVAATDPAESSRATSAAAAVGTDTALLAALRAERDSARVERRRLQLRFDSLEAEVRRNSARSAADDSTSAAELRRRLASDSAARAEAREAAELNAADSARRMAAVERRRADALSIVESSIPSITEVRESERGLTIVLGNDLFARGQSDLGERARIELRAVASLFALYPDARMVIEGHTDSTGSAEVNQRLSEARAESVRGALIAHGIASDRITARGFGETQPIAGNASAEERARNRRAEIIIVGARRPRPGSE